MTGDGGGSREHRPRTVARFMLLTTTSILGMAAVLNVAYIVTTLTAGVTAIDWGVALFLTIIGGVSGVFTMPAVVGFLTEADLRKALPFIYLTSATLTTGWVWLGLRVLVPALVFTPLASIALVSIMSAIAGRLFPINPFNCPKCGYFMRGLREPGCPECGHGRGGAVR